MVKKGENLQFSSNGDQSSSREKIPGAVLTGIYACVSPFDTSKGGIRTAKLKKDKGKQQKRKKRDDGLNTKNERRIAH